MKSVYRWLRSTLVLCLVLGWAGYVPVVSPAAAQAVDSTSLRLTAEPVDPADEEAIIQENLVREAADRARALASTTHTADEEMAMPAVYSSVPPGAPAVDLTVGSATCMYPTVTAAIAAANPGDRLLLEGGVTFTENIYIEKNLTVRGGYNGCGSSSSENTTLDGGGTGRVVYLNEDINVTLENLNITHGYSNMHGAGIYVRYNTQLTGNNLNIYNNTADVLGGGVRLYGGRATFTNTNIYNNTAPLGAGIHGDVGNAIVPVLTLLSYSEIYENNALTGGGLGGGLYMNQGVVSISNCSDIDSNHAISGGGIYLDTSTLTVAGSCTQINNNTATSNGGGVYAVDDSMINLDQGTTLNDNEAGYGGGAYLDNSILMSDSGWILRNIADDYGGGVYATNGSLFDMDLGGYACSNMWCSQLVDNTATTMYGGGVYASDTSEVDLQQTSVEFNSAAMGGGIYAYQSPVYLNNTLVARNDATYDIGDGIRLFTEASLTGSHNTLAFNNNTGTNGDAINLSGATLTLSNSIIWAHASSIDAAGQTVTCSDIQGAYVGAGNINADPLFISAAANNFHLQNTSPAIDGCVSSEERDLENDYRPAILVRPATPYDMGADEVSLKYYLPLAERP
jgi:predicted outer membrane repeat protein